MRAVFWGAVLTLCCAGAQAQMPTQTPARPGAQPPSSTSSTSSTPSAAASAAVPAYIGQRDSSPQELQAIAKLTEDFQAAVAAKNSRALSALMFSANILFASPAADSVAQRVRDTADVTFDGIGGAGLGGFLRFVATSPQALQQKFYNVRIVQDGHVATVDFDYDFLVDGRSENHGVESWQLYKTEGNWKILSVVWSMHAAGSRP